MRRQKTAERSEDANPVTRARSTGSNKFPFRLDEVNGLHNTLDTYIAAGVRYPVCTEETFLCECLAVRSERRSFVELSSYIKRDFVEFAQKDMHAS